MAVGEYDGLGVAAGVEKLVGRGDDGFGAAGQAGINEHPLAGCASLNEVDVYKALNAQLGDAGGYNVHEGGVRAIKKQIPETYGFLPKGKGLAAESSAEMARITPGWKNTLGCM